MLYKSIFASRSLVQPYTLEKYMKDKISAKLEEKRTKRVQVQTKLPNVNKDLFLKLKDLETTKKKNKAANLVKLVFLLKFNSPWSSERTYNFTFRQNIMSTVTSQYFLSFCD